VLARAEKFLNAVILCWRKRNLKRANCLVKAENYTQATAIFENLPLSDPGTMGYRKI
jgi:hypothetical protein